MNSFTKIIYQINPIVFSFCCLIVFPAIAQSQILQTKAKNTGQAVFNWEAGLCEYKGLYDSSKYSKQQLENTLQFTQLAGSVLLKTDATVFNLGDIAQLSIDKLTKEYTQKFNYYKTLPVVPEPFWEDFKMKIIQSLKEEYDLKKITIEAYSNPSVLKKTPYVVFCSDYVEAISAKDTALLFETWKKLTVLQSKKNSDRKRIMDEFSQQHQSPNWPQFAKNYLMVFGWWNCANEHILHIASDEKLYQRFTKLFKSVSHKCDEP